MISQATEKVLNHADEYSETEGLDLLVIRPECTDKDLLKKIDLASERILNGSLRVNEVKTNRNISHSKPSQSGDGYFQLSHRESLADDVDLQLMTMIKLCKSTSKMLRALRDEYEKYVNKGKKVLTISNNIKSNKYTQESEQEYIGFILRNYQNDPLKGFDHIMWRVEIDLENVEDLVKQF